MKVTKRQLQRIIREERAALREDAIDTELDHLKKNISNDLDHVKDLKDDIKDDHEEEVRAEKEKHRKDEALRRRLKAIIREMHHDGHHQGYDAREDERLAALHGAAADHDQSYKARRDDAEFEERHHHEDQGYDDREDERLAAKHGSAAHHKQDYAARRGDAGFEHHKMKKHEVKRLIRKMIREERARAINEAADPKVDSIAGIVQTAVDSGDGDIFTMADKLQAAGLPAEYMSGMGMRYVQVPHDRGHIVVISKNSVEPDSETVIVGPYAIGYMGE